MVPRYLIVGTANTPHLYTLAFTPPTGTGEPACLEGIHRSNTIGSHSWLHLRPVNSKQILYATAWTETPSLVAYAIDSPTDIQQISKVTTTTRSGYVCASDIALYSAAGAIGEVYQIDAETGGFKLTASSVSGEHQTPTVPLQKVDFVKTSAEQKDDGSVLDFGGLRHGAHSADLSPNGKALYIADIGRNCIWAYAVHPGTGLLSQEKKYPSPRGIDGPRHTHPHPNGKYLYCVQEHSSRVDFYAVGDDSVSLTHVMGKKVIPGREDTALYWADEVRTSLSDGEKPKYLYASTRGLESDKAKTDKYRKGWVCAFKLREDGMVDDGAGRDEGGALHMCQTPTSGGWSNAIQPGPTFAGVEYIALTDAEESQVMVLAWDGKRFEEAARVRLDQGAMIATAVWL